MTDLLDLDWSNPWGVVSDAHGNPYGLEACLNTLKARRVAHVFFLGDAVGYLPLERGVLDQLGDERAICISGNHEAMLLGKMPLSPDRDEVYRLEEARERMTSSELEQIRSWPDRIAVTNPNSERSILFIHGGPFDPWGQYVYEDSDIDGFEELGHNEIFLGQTHRPFVRATGDVKVVNVGSCGLPRDVGNLASCAVYDPRNHGVEIIRVAFDDAFVIEQAQQVASVPAAVLKTMARRNKRDQ